MSKRAGKFGKVNAGGAILNVSSWKAKHMVGEDDVTDTGSNGMGESLDGIARVEWSLEAFWDTAKNPYTNPPNLTPGIAGAVQLFVNTGDTNPLYNMAATFISDVSVDLSVPNAVKYTITGKSQGAFTINS